MMCKSNGKQYIKFLEISAGISENLNLKWSCMFKKLHDSCQTEKPGTKYLDLSLHKSESEAPPTQIKQAIDDKLIRLTHKKCPLKLIS